MLDAKELWSEELASGLDGNKDKKVSFKEIIDIAHAEFGENNISTLCD